MTKGALLSNITTEVFICTTKVVCATTNATTSMTNVTTTFTTYTSTEPFMISLTITTMLSPQLPYQPPQLPSDPLYNLLSNSPQDRTSSGLFWNQFLYPDNKAQFCNSSTRDQQFPHKYATWTTSNPSRHHESNTRISKCLSRWEVWCNYCRFASIMTEVHQ